MEDAAITSIQAVYVPADDITDPAVGETFTHLDCSIVLSRAQASQGLYSTVDPPASISILLDPLLVGDGHYQIAEEARRLVERYRELQEVRAIALFRVDAPPHLLGIDRCEGNV